MQTKLILIDGMTGSGKSTTAHFLARQMEKNNIKVKWFHEEENNHPLVYKQPTEPNLSEAEKLELFLKNYPMQWQQFAEEAIQFEGVYISESHLFQSTLMQLFRFELDDSRIKEFMHNLISRVAILNPVVIDFYQDDVKKALNLNWNRRGENWKNWYLDRVAKGKYAQSRQLDGETAAYQIWEHLTRVSLELMNEFTMPKLLIENSAQNWPEYRKRILIFLEIPPVEEVELRDDDARFCGSYSLKYDDEIHGSGELNYRVYIHENRLCMDAFWPGLKLLPKTENEFEIESFPFELRFNSDENNNPTAIEITKAAFYFEPGMKLERVCEKLASNSENF